MEPLAPMLSVSLVRSSASRKRPSSDAMSYLILVKVILIPTSHMLKIWLRVWEYSTPARLMPLISVPLAMVTLIVT